jgi:two-component system response regulator RpfG
MPNVVNLRNHWTGRPLSAIATKQVLIIDDQKSARVILEGIIRSIDRHIAVRTFASPLEAIEWARSNVPDLVLCDFKMREIDGIETIKRLRRLSHCTDIPIVMVTVIEDSKICHDAFDAGATDFLVKPYDQYECRARCRNLLTMREQHLLLQDRTKLLEFEIASAVRQMRQRERETIMLAANLAEFHAHQSGMRVLRVARYAGLIAEGMGLPPETVEQIELAATLHDVGKIGIAEDILLADPALTESQEKTLREHTEIGYRLLERSSSEYLQMAAEISLHHHERYDGMGYPRGLAGREIPLPARIVAVAEAFDILTSAQHRNETDRIAAALNNVLSRKCTEFDPVCVEALHTQMDKAAEVLASFVDQA